MNTNIYFLFLFAIILHNLEEALWLPQWSKYAKKFHKEVAPHEFHFALIIVTAFAVMITSGIVFNPNNKIIKFFYFGLLGLMILNAIFPHLLATLALKRYAPGTITALILNVPINTLIIYHSVNAGVISLNGVMISTIVIGITCFLCLPLLFKLGRIVKDYNN